MDLFDHAKSEGRDPFAPPARNERALTPNQQPDDFRRVVQVLADRRGQEHAITAVDIARASGLFPQCTPGSRARKVRELLERHYDDLPFPVCADATGFFRARTSEEIRHYDNNLTSRASLIFQRRSSLRRVASVAGYPLNTDASFL